MCTYISNSDRCRCTLICLVSSSCSFPLFDFVSSLICYQRYNGKITEDQKAQICNSIDCNKLSPQLVLEAVENPIMPLRFIVRAMLVEQLNTRRSIFSTAAESQPFRHRIDSTKHDDPTTLGALLERDAALRQAAHLRAAMNATSSRIQSLEKELSVMRKLLNESESQRSIMGSARSASFHYGSENKIDRTGERGSASSRFHLGRERALAGSSSSEDSCNATVPPRRTKNNIRQRLINGLKSAFRASKSASKNGLESRKSSCRMDQKGVLGEEDDYEDIIVHREYLRESVA